MTQYEKKLKKIIKKIYSITSMGPDGKVEYIDYINDLVDSGDYSTTLNDAILKEWTLDISRYKTVQEMQDDTFDIFRLTTIGDMQTMLYDLFDSNNLYRIGQNVFDSTTNNKLGYIKEYDKTVYVNQYYKDPELKEKQDSPENTYLEAYKSATYSITIDDGRTIPEKYQEAITFLKS